MCGPAGSGKTTVARRLEESGMARLSFDEEAWRRGIRSMPLTPEAHREIEAQLRTRLIAFVCEGVDVVLDFSFWSRSERDRYRNLLRPLGVEPETIYVETPRDFALERVRRRQASHQDEFQLDPDLAATYYDHFEPPSQSEGPLTIISGTEFPTAG